MKLSALINLPVRDANGQVLGRLHEIHAVDGKVTELVYGPAGLFERLTGRAQPKTIPWSRVGRVDGKGIVLN
jgi:sporulation protein YlmC with PRC-barrel domain